MAEYVVMPKADYEAACDSIRAKTGKMDLIKSGELSTEIASITGGGGGSSADVRYVTFVNGATGEQFVKPVAYGDDCVDVVERGLWAEPTKPSDAQYHYTFYDWGATDGGAADENILKNITEDKTVYAIFSKTVRTYTITWLDEDGVTELPGQKEWAYGATPSYAPTKDGAKFSGWTPALETVTEDATYVASWVTVTASGTYTGSDTEWELHGDTVYVIGTGTVKEYNSYQNCFGDYATQIKHAVVCDGITEIGQYVFNKCSNLTSVILPNSVTSIGDYAFRGDNGNLSSVTLPQGLLTIGKYAFRSCSALTSITLPNTLTSIGDSAFQSSGLTSITIPASVTTIDNSFYNAMKLTEIIVDENNPVYSSDSDGVLFNKDKTELIKCPCGISITTYWVPSSVTTINRYSFYNASTVTDVAITTSGWYVTQTKGATSGTAVTVNSSKTAANYLKNTYAGYYWYRS